LGDALVGDVDVLGDERGRLDGQELVGQEGLAGVVLGDEPAGDGLLARQTDQADGAADRRLGDAVTAADGDRGPREADLILELDRAFQLHRLLLLAETLPQRRHTDRYRRLSLKLKF